MVPDNCSNSCHISTFLPEGRRKNTPSSLKILPESCCASSAYASVSRTFTWESKKCSFYFGQLCAWLAAGIVLIKNEGLNRYWGKISVSATVSHCCLDKFIVVINKALTDLVTATSLASSLVTYL